MKPLRKLELQTGYKRISPLGLMLLVVSFFCCPPLGSRRAQEPPACRESAAQLEKEDPSLTSQNETSEVDLKASVKGHYYLDILDVQALVSYSLDFPGPRFPLNVDFACDSSIDGRFACGPEELTGVIRKATGEECWEDPASLEIHRGQLIIFQRPEVHKQVRSILNDLCLRGKGLFVQIKTYFIQLFDAILCAIDLGDSGLAPPNSSLSGFENGLKTERVTRTDQVLLELRRNFQQSCELIKTRDYPTAITRLEAVLEQIKWTPYKIENEGIEEQSRQKLIEARSLLADQKQKENQSSQKLEVAPAGLGQ